MSEASKEFEYEKNARVFPIWDCGSPLYDSSELVSLSHIIERHMMEWPYLGGSKQIITNFSDPDEVMISTVNVKGSSKWIYLSELLEKIMWKRKVAKQGKGKKHKKMQFGFSGFYHRLICGASRVLT